MKRNLVVAGLLFLLAFAVIAVSYVSISGQKDQVAIKETVLAGDPAAAEGIGLKFRVCERETGQLLWRTDYRIGRRPQSKTVFERIRGGRYSEDLIESSASFYGDFPMGTNNSGDTVDSEESAAIKALIRDVASRTENGRTHSETLQMKDYFDSYPLSLQISLLEKGSLINVDTSQVQGFKISVPDHSSICVLVTKDKDGKISNYQISPDSLLSIETKSVFTPDGCYLIPEAPSYSNRHTAVVEDGSVGERPQRRLPASMRGIHLLPFKAKEKDGSKWYQVDWEKARLIYPISSGVEVCAMKLNPDGSKLLLFTTEDGEHCVSVIDRKSMKLLQKIHLEGGRGAAYQNMECRSSQIFVLLDNGQFYLLTQKGAQYDTELSGRMKPFPHIKDGAWLTFRSFDYDGKRLVIAASFHIDGYLFVFDKKGLQYAGCYQNSLYHESAAEDSPYGVLFPAVFEKGSRSAANYSQMIFQPMAGLEVRL